MAKRPPAKTLESREKEMVSYAVDLAEQQLRDGTASPSVITHFLKLGTSAYELEKEKLRCETELMQSKKRNLDSTAKVEELIQNAVDALRRYSGEERYD